MERKSSQIIVDIATPNHSPKNKPILSCKQFKTKNQLNYKLYPETTAAPLQYALHKTLSLMNLIDL